MSETPNTDSTMEYTAPVETEKNPYVPPPEPPTKPLKKKRGWLWLFFLLLLIAGGSSYFAYQLWLQLQNHQAQQTAQVQHSHAASNALQQEITDLKHNLQNLQNLQPQQLELQQHIKMLQAQQQSLQKAYTQLYNKLRRTGDEDDWSVAEVGYLLRIAQQRLSLGNDLSAALQALQAADQRLRNAGALFLPVREQLTKDIQQLQSLDAPDIEGMALRLAEYTQRTEKLPLLQGQRAEQPLQQQIETAQIGTPRSYHWRDIADTLWGEMSKLVVIRYNDNADTGLLSPSQREFLTDNLRVKLETARLLLLNRNTEQFRLEIKTLLLWLQRYYDLQNKSVNAMYSDLERMQKITLKPDLPDVSKSLAVLEQLNRTAGDTTEQSLPDQEQVLP